jgi:transcriptional regulator with GAF, ATPase, and Fis domain
MALRACLRYSKSMAHLEVTRCHPVSAGSISREDPGTWIETVGPALVGNITLDVAQHVLKQAMLSAALERTAGNLAHAARLLGVTRQAIQQMLTRYEMRDLPRVMRHVAS